MQIKTFHALDMREALRMIKEELGSEAIILSSKEVKTGSGVFGLFSRPMVEVTAAVDRGPAGPNRQSAPLYNGDVQEDRASILSHGRLREGRQTAQTMTAVQNDNRRSAEREAPPGNALLGSNGMTHAITPSYGRFSDHVQHASLIQSLHQELAEIKQEVSAMREQAYATALPKTGWSSLEEELRGVRKLMSGLVRKEQEQFVESLSAPLRATHDWLADSGVEPALALTIVQDVQRSLPLNDDEMADRLRQSIVEHLRSAVRIAGPLLEDGRNQKAVMVVGPTGVGKTTTIAKLAAYYALQHRRKVALITLDTYRVAAVEQLRVYGNILQVAVDVALTCDDLAGLLRLRKDADLILIDTAGRSPMDEATHRELKSLLMPTRSVEAHLVLSAATKDADLSAMLSRFSALPVSSLIFSKLDETTQYGSIITSLQRSGLPLSYLTTGQRVPEDMEVATHKGLASLLLDGLPGIRSVKQPSAAATPTIIPKTAAPRQVMPATKTHGAQPTKGSLLEALGRALSIRPKTK